jgi:F0F1-type ATP synthase assembly protein I
LFAKETLSQYELRIDVEHVDWLREDMPTLAGELLPAQFRMTLEVTAHGFRAKLRIHGKTAELKCDCDEAALLGSGEPLPSETVETFETLQDTLRSGAVELPLAEICDLLDKLAVGGADTQLTLHLFLDKIQASKRLAAGARASERPKVVSFLFPEALVTDLKQRSLDSFEKEYCQHGRRTVIAVFGFAGWLSSDVIAVCGHGHEDKLVDWLTRALSEEALTKISKTLELRQSQRSWAFPTTWLTPDMFALGICLPGDDAVGAEISRQLSVSQILLSAIFLADSVEFRDGEFWVEYRGLRGTPFPLNRAELLRCAPQCAKALYQLYAYAYDGFSADKLEIAQQFLSLTAENLISLCDRAGDVKDATKKTHDQALVKKIEDYFGARHKIQERIKTAVAETSSSVIDLTRDVSADLYKIAGILVGAVVGAILKPDLSSWAFLGASLVIMAYLGLVILYYLATLKRTYRLRIDQHTGYIRSFRDVLRAVEIDDFLGDEHLGKAEAVFSSKCKQATVIYTLLLIVALIIFVASVIGLLGQGSVLPFHSPLPPP